MRNKTYSLPAVAALILLATSCTKNFEQINSDPNHALTIDYSALLTNAELITTGNSDGNAYEAWRGNLIYSSCLIQHMASVVGYWDGDKYLYSASYNSAYWDQNYGPQSADGSVNSNSSPIQNIVEVVSNTKNNTAKSNLYNIARIFKVFQFQRLTDLYGDIPYSEAGLGYISSITLPKYDKQSDIYPDMLNELQDAASKLDASADLIGAPDLIYGGDVTLWKKFAYSEMLRLAMRLVKVDPANAQKYAAMAAAGGTFSSAADNAIVTHQLAAPNGAGSQVADGSGSVLRTIDPAAAHLSQSFVNLLKSTNDPRISFLGTVIVDPTVFSDMGDTTAAHQLGMPNGYDLGGGTSDISTAPGYPGNQNDYSYVNRYTFSREDAPTFFLTYAETEFLLAEAAERGWIADAAATHYNNGVTGAMAQLVQAGAGPSPAQAAAYLAANPYNPADALNQINTQYYISTFLDGYEAWANWKRTGFPVLIPVAGYPGNVTDGTIPRRLTYPSTEAGVNPTNYAAAVSDLDNGDKMTSHVWWDKP
jgi:Starch-binding associating with outer membrane